MMVSFQSLIGTLQTGYHVYFKLDHPMFQSLIGTLQTSHSVSLGCRRGVFQSLIGTLQTGHYKIINNFIFSIIKRLWNMA
ncbi:hypothetical protein A4H02_09520 [Fervidobacterium thailandense]|uniref:Uncharacterized protein n=1 Tax=Fervidobacterium thailandense TaxID=1008305 RepID=A0A1E3G0C3_9BACT|nr:hypothetical protein A4H02_09520 [Fervidobacterium thailandense]